MDKKGSKANLPSYDDKSETNDKKPFLKRKEAAVINKTPVRDKSLKKLPKASFTSKNSRQTPPALDMMT
jgi:hypothetical protein